METDNEWASYNHNWGEESRRLGKMHRNQLTPFHHVLNWGEEWRKEALCKGKGDTGAFDCADNADVIDDLAKELCGKCPVRAECFGFAIREGMGFGIYGGTLPSTRRKFVRVAYEVLGEKWNRKSKKKEDWEEWMVVVFEAMKNRPRLGTSKPRREVKWKEGVLGLGSPWLRREAKEG